MVDTVSTTEYRMSRRRTRTPEGEGGGVEGECDQPEQLASGSQRLEARLPAVDAWSTFEAETAEIDLPELAVPEAQLTRVATQPMPLDELTALAEGRGMDNAQTLSGFGASNDAADDAMPVTTVGFGDHQLLIVHRGDAVELIVPGGQRFVAPRTAAAALAHALLGDR